MEALLKKRLLSAKVERTGGKVYIFCPCRLCCGEAPCQCMDGGDCCSWFASIKPNRVLGSAAVFVLRRLLYKHYRLVHHA